MKDLSIEQKAKRYDKAVEIAEKYHNGTLKDVMETIFPALKESEDERIRKALIEIVHDTPDNDMIIDYNVYRDEALAWLEKVGEYLKFCETIQIGDDVTRNEGGVLVNMSQLDRIAKPRKKNSEQNLANKYGKVEPKFKVGDMVVSTRNPHLTYKILQVGLPNELGTLDYEVEIFTDGKAGIKVGNTFEEHNIHLISCDKMEAWGIVRL